MGNIQFWTWLDGDDSVADEEIRSFYRMMKNRGMDGVLPSGSDNYYRRVGPICKELDLGFHPWRWTVNRSGHEKDHPEWYAVSREGKSTAEKPPYVDYYRWLCPTREETRQLIISDYVNLCSIEGTTGVHLDYVRYCDIILPIALQPKYNLIQDQELAPYDFCYCDTCRSRFKEDHGYDPLDRKDPTTDQAWRRWRLDRVVSLVNEIKDAVHRQGKEISGAIFPTPRIARGVCRQDWERFNLDTYMPMMYFKDYDGDLEWVEDVIEENRAVIRDRANLFCGLNMGHVREYGLEKVMVTCLKHNIQGITLFTGGSLTDEEWDVFERISYTSQSR